MRFATPMRLISAASLLVFAVMFSAPAKPQSPAATATGIAAGRAAGRTMTTGDPVLEAMVAELERSKSGLKMDQIQAPYYIEYRLSEIEGYGAEAAFGALRDEQKYRVRYLRAVVRVGDYKQDSYFGQGAGVADVMPLDNDPAALRHQIWLVTDQAYKAASEALTAKQAMLKQFNVDQPVDDFAHATPLQSVGALAKLEYSPERWKKVLENATGLYRKYPDVQSVEGSVRFTAVNEYFVNSEGTVTRQGHATYAVTLSGATQAPDGMRLERSPYYMVAKPEELPSDATIAADAAKMLDTIVRLRQAPIVEEEYRGPVVFYADAADDVFAGLVGNNVLGRKPQPGKPARTTGQYATSFRSRVLPEFMTIVDDPTMKEFQGHSLVGSYDVDSEGVKAAPVTVIDKGQLTSYLLGREPIRDFPESNGHARAGFGAGPTPSTANLIVRAEKSSSLGDLKKQMIEMCRNQGRPYGYYVETLGPGMAPRLLYRIWEKDGREELVRGAVFNELDVRTLRNNLAAAGNDPLVSNRPGGLPTSVISPSVLFDELEVKRADTSKDKLPEYPAPPVTNFRSAIPDPKDWSEPFPAHRIMGNVYYAGSRGLASYLIATPAGLILINSNLQSSVPLIRDSVEKLGFRFADIKILLISHAHFDHDGSSAEIKKLTGAKYMVMDGDVGVVESGGRSDFQYGDSSDLLYPAAKVDRVLHDGDEVKLGDTVLTAHRTAGHTRGCTTWSLKVGEAGKTYDVVIVGSPNVNPGYRLVNNARYPEIAGDYERGFHVLKSLHCDVFLGAHGSYYGMEAKYTQMSARIKTGEANPYVDPEGYKTYVAEREQAFLSELQKQTATAKKD